MQNIYSKIAWRIIPFMGLMYVVNFLDRVNVSFAALTMNADLGLGAEAFGIGAGIFFIGYFFFEVPSNVILEKVGTKLWMFRIMLSWGLVSMAMALAQGPWSFYGLRFLLGVAEAGFFPGMMLYLTYWFPQSQRAKFNGLFFAAIPLSSALGSPLSGYILGFDGAWGLHGWQWLFLIEGLPSCILAFAVLFVLPDGPASAKFLNADEKSRVQQALAREAPHQADLWSGLRNWRVLVLAITDIGIVLPLYGLGLWLPQIVKAMGFSNLETGFVVAIPYAVSTLAMVLWARSSDRHNERPFHIAIPCLFAAAGLVGAALLGGNIVVLVALTCASVGIYAALVTYWTLPPSFLGGTAAAGGIALINAVGNLGGFIGPTLMGWLKQATGGYAAGLLSLAGFLLIPAVVVLVLSRVRALALEPRSR
ncbi:MAG TPA: MFS transporter [Rhizomicrobium sp.]|nr:MFS transporter [Rhizomicrobium sp.]